MINKQIITKPSKLSDIYDVKFKFSRDKNGMYHVQNIFTFDTESTTVYYKNGKIESFDSSRYDKGLEARRERCEKQRLLVLADPFSKEKIKATVEEEYTNFIDSSEPISFVYKWQLGCECASGTIRAFVGNELTTFDEFFKTILYEAKRQLCFGFKCNDREKETEEALSRNYNVRIYVYIHNLGHDLTFLRNIWESKITSKHEAKHQKVFARTNRKPMRIRFSYEPHLFVQLCDSLVLTQKSLKRWCKDAKLPIQKAGEIDYTKVRVPETPLDGDENIYIINDVISMIYGIDIYRERFGNLQSIPTTQTGIVRKQICSYLNFNNRDWCESQCMIMKNYSYDFFLKLTQLFQGGWTHARADIVEKVFKNVTLKSFDFASSYPATMCRFRMPIGEFEAIDPARFDEFASEDVYKSTNRWFAKVKLKNVQSINKNSYWSSSKCIESDGYPMVDNGRIRYIYSMTALFTDWDWDIFKQAYSFDIEEVQELYVSHAGYLPKELIEIILDYFKKKTALKPTDDSDDSQLSLYAEAKEFINSIYGVFVTKIISDGIEFTTAESINDEETKNNFIRSNNGKTGWLKTPVTEEEFKKTMEELKPEQTFGSYQLGIWITAASRHELWRHILNLENMYYADTDSLKGDFSDEELKMIEDYNKEVEAEENRVAAEVGIDPSKYTAVTPKGKVKRLGILEREDDMISFCTLGAKRYAYQTEDGEMHVTVAGLPKKAGTKIKAIDDFKDKIFWGTEESHKQMVVYNDNQTEIDVTDDYGNTYHMNCKYGVAIVPTTFDMTIGPEFARFLKMLKTGKMDKSDGFFKDVPHDVLFGREKRVV